jgi:uncharacterized protein (DUF736 family)
MIIGRFKAMGDGGWAGVVKTLSINAKIRFVPNDNRDNNGAPSFRILCGSSEIGVAWLKRTSGEPAGEYLSVTMDCPSFTEPISAALFYAGIDRDAELVWRRVRSQPRIGGSVPNS